MAKKIKQEDYFDGYYHIGEDLEACPEAWCYNIWSARGPGKTYSTLRYFCERNIKFVYMRRRSKDIDRICKDNGDLDMSPFNPLNRDRITNNVRCFKTDDGFGVFSETHEEEDEKGKVQRVRDKDVGYLVAINAAYNFKGVDLSDVDVIIADEYIPQPGEVCRKDEGVSLLNFFRSVERDRIRRGRGELKLIMLANSEDITCAITNTMEMVDDIAEMVLDGNDAWFNEKRGIFYHHLTADRYPVLEDYKKSGLYKAMKDTAWGDISYGGEFARNDFTNIKFNDRKSMSCEVELTYGHNKCYIYRSKNDGRFYVSHIKNKAKTKYNLNRDAEARRFYIDWALDLRQSFIFKELIFEKYSYYDLIVNYEKHYKVTWR